MQPHFQGVTVFVLEEAAHQVETSPAVHAVIMGTQLGGESQDGRF